MTSAPSFFSHSQNVNVSGGDFTAVTGDAHYHLDRRGLHSLSQVISHGAVHDSSERFPPAKCDPGTRKEVLKLIEDWIDDPSPSCSVLWLYGPAGTGKTAILQSIAELLNLNSESQDQSTRRRGGSFFFSKGKPGRDQADRLFSTIGYQLAVNLPSLRDHVDSIMTSDPTLHTKSMEAQLNSLIFDAFRKLRQEGTELPHTPTVIIDGLDECQGNQIQQNILALISKAVIDKIPLRFLIASRSEAHIRECFDQMNLRTITRRVVLDDSFNPNKDIELILRKGFAEIYTRNRHIMSQASNNWPGDGIIDQLVQKASGQFIYATTVLNFVGAEFCIPTEQLKIVLAPNPSYSESNDPFSDLDVLYTHILSVCRNPRAVVQVLGVILALHCPQPPEVIEDILSMEKGEVTIVLQNLHSLIQFPGMKDEIYERGLWKGSLLHGPFRDYLVDEDRSGQFFVNIAEAHAQLTVAGFKLMTRWILHYPTRGDSPRQRPRLNTWGYLQWHLAPHFATCPASIRAAIIEDLEAFQQEFSMIIHKADGRILFDALHCAMTVLVHMMFGEWDHYEGLADHSDAGQDRTLIDVLDVYPQVPEIVEYATIYYQYRSILDECYASFTAYDGANLSTLTHLIDSVPGFLVQKTMLPVKAIADLYLVNLDLDLAGLEALLKRNEQFVSTSQRPYAGQALASGATQFSPQPQIRLNRHVADFLLNKTRSGPHHIPSSSHHAVMCSYAVSMFYDLNWSRLSNLDENVNTYLFHNFYGHLHDLDIYVDELVKEHPTSKFLSQLDNIIYYSPDMREAPIDLFYIWQATDSILGWVQRQQLLLDSGSESNLQERLHRIADRIYGQILYVELRSLDSADGERNEVGVITLCPLFLVRVKDIIVGVENPQSGSAAFQKFGVDTVMPERLMISDDFLLVPDILPSLTEYLTNIKRAGLLYISPDEYHTQLAEYCLEFCTEPDSEWISGETDFRIMKMLAAQRNWKYNLVRALPSKHIFARLRVCTFYPSSLESFKDIVKWLEGLPEPPLDVYIRWQMKILKMEERKKENEEGLACFRYSIVQPPLPVDPLREAPQIGYHYWTENMVRWIKYGLSSVFRWIFST